MVSINERLALLERPGSSAAVWCQRLALFSVPYLVIVILGHRIGSIETIPAFWLFGLGILMLLASVVAGIRGFYELWTYGYKGGLKAARGTALAIILLLPVVYQGLKAFTLPPLYDVSTDLEEVPTFDAVIDDRTDAMNAILDPTDVTRRLQLKSYPRVAARRYPLGSARVFRAVVALITDRDWVILTANTIQGEAKIDEEGSGLIAKSVEDENGLPLRPSIPRRRPSNGAKPALVGVAPPVFETVQVSPVGREEVAPEAEQEERYIEAVARSLLFGFESDVIIRIIEEEEGTLVDMRSNSRWGPHDLGSNATRITSFMGDLDTALQGLGS